MTKKHIYQWCIYNDVFSQYFAKTYTLTLLIVACRYHSWSRGNYTSSILHCTLYVGFFQFLWDNMVGQIITWYESWYWVVQHVAVLFTGVTCVVIHNSLDMLLDLQTETKMQIQYYVSSPTLACVSSSPPITSAKSRWLDTVAIILYSISHIFWAVLLLLLRWRLRYLIDIAGCQPSPFLKSSLPNRWPRSAVATITAEEGERH